MDSLSPLFEIANWYYYTADLANEGDELLPEGYWESDEGVRDVLIRAFGSSDCGDFAVMLHEMTGYPIVNLMGLDGIPIHSFVRTPDGQALDILGTHSDMDVAKRYGFHGKNPTTVVVDPQHACGYIPSDEWTDQGLDERACRIAAVIRQLPWSPFDTPQFRAMSQKPLAGVDFAVETQPPSLNSQRPLGSHTGP